MTHSPGHIGMAKLNLTAKYILEVVDIASHIGMAKWRQHRNWNISGGRCSILLLKKQQLYASSSRVEKKLVSKQVVIRNTRNLVGHATIILRVIRFAVVRTDAGNTY